MRRNARIGGCLGMRGLTLAMIAMTAGGSATTAHAEVIIHDNRDGTFPWTMTVRYQGTDPFYGTFLDIRQPPTQSGERGPGGIGNWVFVSDKPNQLGSVLFQGEFGSGIQFSHNVNGKTITWNNETVLTYPVREYAVSEYVESNAAWLSPGEHFRTLPFSESLAGGIPLIESPSYVGVRLKTGVNQYNYGWILFEDWTRPLMWAYETEINKPIQIPIPSPAGLCLVPLAIGVTLRRRRPQCLRADSALSTQLRSPRHAALAASALMLTSLGATTAHAEVIVHDNRDGTFQWIRTIKLTAGDPIYGTFLDIRQPPTQSGERRDGTLGSWFRFNNSGSTPGRYQVEGYDQDVRVAIEDTEKKFTWNGQSLSLQPLRAYAAGEMILPNHLWPSTAMHYLSLPFINDFQGGTPLIPDLAYLGVRIQTGTNKFNYGWVLFENWTNPVMWAYETTPNTPIQIPIPAPGVAGFIAVVSSIVCIRRQHAIASS